MTTNTELPGWFLEVNAVLEKLVEPVRYPPIETSTNDRDGLPLLMTGKTAVRRRLEVLEAARQARAAERDAALVRVLQWTGHWGG
jgi:hypothetical protein